MLERKIHHFESPPEQLSPELQSELKEKYRILFETMKNYVNSNMDIEKGYFELNETVGKYLVLPEFKDESSIHCISIVLNNFELRIISQQTIGGYFHILSIENLELEDCLVEANFSRDYINTSILKELPKIDELMVNLGFCGALNLPNNYFSSSIE